jgi:hypothetical protein
MQDVNRQQELVFRTIIRVTRELGGAPPDGIEETNGAVASEGPLGHEDSSDEGEGTRMPKKGGQEMKAPRRRSEAELLGPPPSVPSSGRSSRRSSIARGPTKGLKRAEDIVEWDWPV